MMEKHTPGPWHSVQYGHWFNIQTEPYYEDAVNLLDLEECDRAEANAKLMEAAPELLAFAQDFVNKVETGRAKSTDSYNKAKAAIKKATI